MEHPWGKEIQVGSNKVPRVMYDPSQGLEFYIVIYREMLKKSSSQELGRKHAWRMGIQIFQIKGLVPFGAK